MDLLDGRHGADLGERLMAMYRLEINEYKKGIYEVDLETASDLEHKIPRIEMSVIRNLIELHIRRIREYRWTHAIWKGFLDSLPEGLVTNTDPKEFDICHGVITNQAIGYVVENELSSNMPPGAPPIPSIWSYVK